MFDQVLEVGGVLVYLLVVIYALLLSSDAAMIIANPINWSSTGFFDTSQLKNTKIR